MKLINYLASGWTISERCATSRENLGGSVIVKLSSAITKRTAEGYSVYAAASQA
ncbi:MAG: hypothetical protein ACYC10_20455 [Allorhizobium sp.]